MDKKKKNKKIALTIISLIVVAALLLALGTYAYWQITHKQTNRNRVGSACLSITFTNESNDIDLPNMFPTSVDDVMSDTAKYPPYTFTITNTCDTLVNYTVALESIVDDQTEEENAYLNYDYVSVMLDNNGYSVYSSLDTMTNDDDSDLDYEIRDTKKIVTRRLQGGASRTHYLNLWLDENTPYENADHTLNTEKYFFGKIKIIAGQGIEEECYSVNSNGVLYAYDSDCGRSATIPATVNGNQVKTISSNAFKGTVTGTAFYGNADADQANNPLESIEDSWYMSGTHCYYETSTACQVDYEIIYPYGLYQLMIDEDAVGAIMEEQGLETEEELINYLHNLYTVDQFYAIITYTGNDATRLSRIEEEVMETLASNPLGYSAENQEIYTIGDSCIPNNDNVYIIYQAVNYSDGAYSETIGYSIPSEPYTGLTINSLDLTQATYLETIERLAFSNFEDTTIESIENMPAMDDVRPGLTSLTFGNNTNSITVGNGAFAGANLNNLTIYTSLSMPEITLPVSAETGVLRAFNTADILNPFAYSIIGTLTVKPTQTDTVFDLGEAFENMIRSASGVEDDSINYSIASKIFAFYNLTYIGNLNIYDGVTNVKYIPSVLETSPSDSTVTNITLPSSLTKIDKWAFALYDDSTLPTIPSSVTEISDGAFALFSGTGSSLTIPSSVTTIGPAAFELFNGSSLTLNNGLTTIGKYAFRAYVGSGSDLTIPSTVTTIGESAFSRKTGNIYVYSQDLYDNAINWKGSATVTLISGS